MNDTRTPLLDILAAMPDEAFGYVVLALKGVVEQHEANHGFTPDSTKSFVEIAKQLNAYVGEEIVNMQTIRDHNPALFEDGGA